MELRSLGTDFQPDLIIENYDSLIWTERYREAGEFQLKTADVDATRALMPLDTMITVKGSTDCMIVEDHVIEKDAGGDMNLTVSGRSFETFLESRTAEEPGGVAGMFYLDNPNAGVPQYNWQLAAEGGAASEFVEEIIKYKTNGKCYASELISNLTVTVATNARASAGFPLRTSPVKIGTAYERILELLEMDDLGIKCVLPASGANTINLRIFAGNDVSATVILSVSAGDFEKTSYAFSSKNYRNAVVGVAAYNTFTQTNNSSTGLQRRFGWVDATDIKTNPSTKAKIQARMDRYLKAHKKTTVFSGEVSSDILYKYGVNYNIGDIVRVIGDYKVNQLMRVAEYTRIEDKQGERAFPGLEEP